MYVTTLSSLWGTLSCPMPQIARWWSSAVSFGVVTYRVIHIGAGHFWG